MVHTVGRERKEVESENYCNFPRQFVLFSRVLLALVDSMEKMELGIQDIREIITERQLMTNAASQQQQLKN